MKTQKTLIFALMAGLFALSSCSKEYIKLTKPIYKNAQENGIQIQAFTSDSSQGNRAVVDTAILKQGKAGSIEVLDENKEEEFMLAAFKRCNPTPDASFDTASVRVDPRYPGELKFVWSEKEKAYLLDAHPASQKKKKGLQKLELGNKKSNPENLKAFLDSKGKKKPIDPKKKKDFTLTPIEKDIKGVTEFSGFIYTVRYGKKPYLLIQAKLAEKIEKKRINFKGMPKLKT